jgi:hypothetical protein
LLYITHHSIIQMEPRPMCWPRSEVTIPPAAFAGF